MSLQTQIFVPISEPMDGWYETLIGRVILPISDKCEWFWFSHYLNDDIEKFLSDYLPSQCSDIIRDIPKKYCGDIYRSIRFRFSANNQEDIISELGKISRDNGYWLDGFRTWDHIADLGDKRFLARQDRKKNRADLILSLYHYSAKLMLDNLVEIDGRFSMEYNNFYDDLPEECKTCFLPIQHVFCNITNLSSEVIVFRNDKSKYTLGTRFYRPLGKWEAVDSYAIMF